MWLEKSLVTLIAHVSGHWRARTVLKQHALITAARLGCTKNIISYRGIYKRLHVPILPLWHLSIRKWLVTFAEMLLCGNLITVRFSILQILINYQTNVSVFRADIFILSQCVWFSNSKMSEIRLQILYSWLYIKLSRYFEKVHIEDLILVWIDAHRLVIYEQLWLVTEKLMPHWKWAYLYLKERLGDWIVVIQSATCTATPWR